MSAYSFLIFRIFAFKGIDKIKLYGRYLNHRSNPHVKGLCFLKIHLFFWPFCMGRKRWGLIQIIGVILMSEVLVIMERFSSAHRIIPFSNLSLEFQESSSNRGRFTSVFFFLLHLFCGWRMFTSDIWPYKLNLLHRGSFILSLGVFLSAHWNEPPAAFAWKAYGPFLRQFSGTFSDRFR